MISYITAVREAVPVLIAEIMQLKEDYARLNQLYNNALEH